MNKCFKYYTFVVKSDLKRKGSDFLNNKIFCTSSFVAFQQTFLSDFQALYFGSSHER